MGFGHGTGGLVPGATCGPTDHLGHVVFEARRADAVMRLVNGSVRVQNWDVHNPINEFANNGSNRIHPPATVGERGFGSLRNPAAPPQTPVTLVSTPPSAAPTRPPARACPSVG